MPGLAGINVQKAFQDLSETAIFVDQTGALLGKTAIIKEHEQTDPFSTGLPSKFKVTQIQGDYKHGHAQVLVKWLSSDSKGPGGYFIFNLAKEQNGEWTIITLQNTPTQQ